MEKKKKVRKEILWDLDKEYWTLLFRKILETLLSVKVWVIFSVMSISTWLLIHTHPDGQSYINGQVWGTVNTSVISVVIALREGFKISRIRKEGEGMVEDFANGNGHHNHRDRDEYGEDFIKPRKPTRRISFT